MRNRRGDTTSGSIAAALGKKNVGDSSWTLWACLYSEESSVGNMWEVNCASRFFAMSILATEPTYFIHND